MELDSTGAGQRPLDATAAPSGPGLDHTVERPLTLPDRAAAPNVDHTIERPLTLPDGDPLTDDAAPTLARGAAVGRYVLLDPIGAGGMGQVFAAFDPELDRKVALKLVLPGRDQGETRLLREAQALAKLAHPNIVAVYDVGTHAGTVWIAMEFVAGQTLGAWARAAPRRWPELLRVLVDSARGVAAAHAAGLIHRDLKSDNVMIGHDGRVRVMDFGLAHGRHAAATPADPTSAPPVGPLPHRSLVGADSLTMLGDVLGTPAYMAPEQWRGEAAGAAADQFSWSVMAWELLYGERPFTGDTYEALQASVLAGRRRPPPRGPSVPTWLRRIVERGLALAPAQRWPDMASLQHALGRGQARARGRLAAFVLLGLAAVVGLVIGLQRRDVARRDAACTASGAEIDAVWHDEARQRLRAAILATGVTYAETAVASVLPALDAQATAWSAARAEACRNAEVLRTWSADTVDRAQWCLEDRRLELTALVDELVHADKVAVQSASESATSLSAVGPCLDAAQLLRGPPPPPIDQRPDIQAVTHTLLHAITLERLGKYDEALAETLAARARADELDWPALRAEARLVEANLRIDLRAPADAVQASKQAYLTASRAGAWELAARAAIAVEATYSNQFKHDEVRLWAELAEVAIAHAGDPLGLLEANRLVGLASAAANTGAIAEAQAHSEKILALREAAVGPDHPLVGSALYNLAALHYRRNEYPEARALGARVLAIKEASLGPTHPQLAQMLPLLAYIERAAGDHAQAEKFARRQLALEETKHGPTHPQLASALTILASLRLATGDYAEALALARRAVAVADVASNTSDMALAEALLELGRADDALGRPTAAAPLFERSLALYEKTHGPNATNVITPLTGLAQALTASGELARAEALYERARGIRKEGPGLVPILAGLADVKLHAGDPAAALALLTEARTLAASPKVSPNTVARTLDLLGQAHAAAGADADARAAFTEALTLRERTRGPEHPLVGETLVRLAGLALTDKAPQTAMPLLERALTIAADHPSAPPALARLHFTLARALAESRGDLARARAAAVQARDELKNSGATRELAEVEAWLARRRE